MFSSLIDLISTYITYEGLKFFERTPPYFQPDYHKGAQAGIDGALKWGYTQVLADFDGNLSSFFLWDDSALFGHSYLVYLQHLRSILTHSVTPSTSKRTKSEEEPDIILYEILIYLLFFTKYSFRESTLNQGSLELLKNNFFIF